MTLAGRELTGQVPRISSFFFLMCFTVMLVSCDRSPADEKNVSGDEAHVSGDEAHDSGDEVNDSGDDERFSGAIAAYDSMIQFNGLAQGTYYKVTYYDSAARAIQPQVDSILRSIDLSLSLWLDSSTISNLNRAAVEFEVDAHLGKVLTTAIAVNKATQGAFDFTVAPLVNAYGFGPNKAMKMDSLIVDSLLSFIGVKNIKFIKKTGKIIKLDPRVRIDLNGIAQGYTVDVICNYLRSLNITQFLVDVGGEIVVGHPKPDGKPWRVGIDKPTDHNADRKIQAIVTMANRAMATSGNYRKFYEEDGIRYSHTIDPTTGFPARNRILSVTVFAVTAELADAYATAFMVMGLERSQQFLTKNKEYDAYFILSGDSGKWETRMTDGLKKMMEENPGIQENPD